MIKTLFKFLFTLLCFYYRVFGEVSTNIVGGHRVRNADFRSVVSLQYRRGRRWFHFCGGTLINSTHVLTAGHCVRSGSFKGIIVFGRYRLKGRRRGRNYRRSWGVTLHPYYGGLNNDIAVIKLNKPITRIKPMALYTSPQVDPGAPMRVAGWGVTKYGNSWHPTWLREVTVPAQPYSKCSQKYSIVDSRQICAGYDAGGKDSCQGDSGGPLIVKEEGVPKLVGIVSFGRGCAWAGFFGVYTRVAGFLDFINASKE